jgi:hypothetical protein
MDQNDESRRADQGSEGRRGPAIGCLVFVLAFVPCLIASVRYLFQDAKSAVDKMPHDEVYNAIARDSEAMKYFVIDIGVAIVAAAAIAAVVVYCRRSRWHGSRH